MNRNAEKQALHLLVLSMVIFGTIGICRRFIPLPSASIACGRGIMGGLFLLLLQKARRRRLEWGNISRNRFFLLVLTGAMIGANWILLFEAYNYTTVAAATLCYYMQPVIVLALSPLLLKEKLNGKQFFCIAVSVLGMILVSGVLDEAPASAGNGKGILLGLGAAVLYAGVVLMNKRIAGVPVYEKTIIQLFAAAAAMIPYMTISGGMNSGDLSVSQTLLFLVVGIVHTGVAYAVYFGAIERLPAKTCAIFSYIDPVTAVLLSAFLLREPMNICGIAGTVLIIGSALYSEMTA